MKPDCCIGIKILLVSSIIGFLSGYGYTKLKNRYNKTDESVDNNVNEYSDAPEKQYLSDKESEGSNPFLSSPNPKHSDDEDNDSIGFAPPEFQPVKIHYDYWDPVNKKQICHY